MQNFSGLTSEEAKRRLKIYGPNKIKIEKKVSPIKMFLSQFTSPIIILLIIASIISLWTNYIKGESYIDSILILVIVLISAIAGFIQDYKAEKTMEALRKLASPKARVIRDGKEIEIDSSEVVPGDIIILKAGDVIPADAKILDGKLEVNESILTGESKSVKKSVGEKIFSSCYVYSGKAIAKVFATGMNTEIGKIAEKMQEMKDTETPFQRSIRKFTKKIVIVSVFLILALFVVGVKKFGPEEAFLISVSLAVAAIPEDLPAVITIALSRGAKEMAKRNALVRKLAITESIGSVDVICTDKTGTITEGRMKVRYLWFVEDTEYANELAIKCCYYCNDAEMKVEDGKKVWIGDETDIALAEFAHDELNKELSGKRIEEIPFSSERKMMTVAYEINNDKIVFSKGAPEVILSKCNRVFLGRKPMKLTESIKQEILEKTKDYAKKGFRVLALAYKEYEKPLEKNLVFIGLVILADPPRPEVKKAIEECYTAGIRVIMITGDIPETAKAIADEVGLKTEGVLTGDDIDKMDDNELKFALSRGVNVFARTNPFHKLRILEILQKDGYVVAMTGDGVNDSLALKKADVGISMGKRGSEVAKEASDIVLLDDNFATIRNAIKEGRRIFDNIRKFVNYLFTCNVAEILVMFIGTLIYPFILLYPIQILWINLITDGLPALALAVDPARPDIMKRPPRKKNEGIINKKLAALIGAIGIEKSIMILAIFALALPIGIDEARTALFTAFIMFELVRIVSIRYSENLKSIKDWLRNKALLFSLILSILLQMGIIYSPLAKYFKIVPIGIDEWMVIISGTVVGFILSIVTTYLINKHIKE